MHWGDLQLNPDRRTLRQFAAIWIVFFTGLAASEQMLHHRPVLAVVLLVLAVTVGPIGVMWPQAIRRVFVVWSVLAFPIGWVVSWVALSLLFYGVFTPVGLAFRLFGRDALARRRRADAPQTYWVPRTEPVGVSRYFRQS